jgi:hypothetical protein
MANQILASDKLLVINDFGVLGMVQSIDTSAAMNPEEIYELGRTSKVDTAFELESQGSMELISIGNSAGLLARMTPLRVSGDFTGYAFSGAGNKNNYCFTEGDLVETQFDLVIHEKSDNLHFDRSWWFPRQFLTTWSGRADSAGNATETYAFGGQYFAVFHSPYHDIIASPCTVASTSTLDVVNATVAAATYTLVYVYVDAQRFRNNSTSDATKFTLSGTAGSAVLTVTTSEGYTIPSNAICRAVFYKTASPSSTFPTVGSSQRGTTAFYVKGFQVNLYIAPVDPANPLLSEKWLKVQSVDYNVDLQSEALRQLSQNLEGTAIYARVPTLPFNITLTANSYESDLTEWLSIMTNGHTGSSVYTDLYDFAPTNLKGDPTNPLYIVMRYYTKAGTLLQELQFLDMALDAPSERTVVRGRAECTWSFRGTAFKLCGYNA